MLPSLSILILLPLIELITTGYVKKHPSFHNVILVAIVGLSLVISISLPISNQIYVIDFGFLKLKFMCDIYSYFFGILVVIIWLLTNLYAHSYTKLSLRRNKVDSFFKFISLSIFATLGSGYAADLWTLFIFNILLILFIAPLITQHMSKSSLKAKRIYIATHIGTSILFFLPAVILIYYLGGNAEFLMQKNTVLLNNKPLASLLLLLFVFGISKNCVLPFHNWITRSTIAPNPVSALLHSVAAVKSGSIAILKIVVYIFGVEYIQDLTSHFWTGGWIFYLCGITAVYAAYRAWKITDIKKRFAYSTISQLSYIMSGIMIATPLAITGALLHIISHSLCKVVLFYVAGIFGTIYKTRNIHEIAKIAPHLKLWIAIVAFCGASIIGVPMLPGSYGKDYMIISEFKTHHYAALVFLATGSFINILYIYPIVKAAFFTKSAAEIQIKEIPLTMRLSIIIGTILAILMGIFISNFSEFLKLYI